MTRVIPLLCAVLMSACSLLPTKDVDFDVPVLDREDFDGSDAIQPIMFDIVVNDGAPSTDLTIMAPAVWGPLLDATVQAEANGQPRVFRVAQSQAPTFTGDGPVDFTISISSANGEYWGENLAGGTADVPSCSFTLDPGAGVGDLPQRLENCMVDFATANGVPAQLAISITAQLATPSLGVTNFAYSNINVGLQTESRVEFGCSPGLKVSNSVVDNRDNIKAFKSSTLNAEGGSTEGAVLVCWSAYVFDSEGSLKASANGVSAFASGESRDLTVQADGDKISVSGSGQADVNFTPNVDDFLGNTVDALAGTDTGEAGKGFACWWSIGEAPRSGFINVAINGVAEVGI